MAEKPSENQGKNPRIGLNKKRVYKPTIRERKFAAKVAGGMSQTAAYKEVYSSFKNPAGTRAEASRVAHRPRVEALIQAALEAQHATPEFAVAQLMKVAVQDDELGAKRLAAKDILELHGWKKGERQQQTLHIDNAFFGNTRKRQVTEGEIVDGDQD